MPLPNVTSAFLEPGVDDEARHEAMMRRAHVA